jgi:hypothetical protein
MENRVTDFEPTGLDAVIQRIRDQVAPKWAGWAITTHVREVEGENPAIGLSFFRDGKVKRYPFFMRPGTKESAALRYFAKASPND